MGEISVIGHLNSLIEEYKKGQQEIRELKSEIKALQAKKESRRFSRRLSKFLTKRNDVDAAPELIPEADETSPALAVFGEVEKMHDDLRRRYGRTLVRLAEINYFVKRRPLPGTGPPHQLQAGESEGDTRPLARSLPSCQREHGDSVERRDSCHYLTNVRTSVRVSPTLTEIEDVPRVQIITKRTKSTSTRLKQQVKPAMEKLRRKDDIEKEANLKRKHMHEVTKHEMSPEEFRNIIDEEKERYKFNITALLMEISERDEHIESLLYAMELKDSQIAQLAKILS